MKLPLLVAGVCFALTLHAQAPLRLSGSTTVKGALEPKQAALESAIGRPIEFAGTGTAAGLLSLVSGSADVAMLSVPLAEVADLVNRKTPGRVDVAQLRSEQIGSVRIVFVVNPRNPVRTLTSSQLSDLLVGRVENWKQVGGADAPVMVVSLSNGGSLLDGLLQGHEITSKAHTVPNATQIPTLVAQNPNAIGIISAAHPRGQTSVVQTDAEVTTPLFLVTKGEPLGAAFKLVQTARAMLSQARFAQAGSTPAR